MAFLGNLFGGSNKTPQTLNTQQVSRFNPQQEAGFSQILEQALAEMKNQKGFGPIADMHRKQFRKQTIPTIAERFTADSSQGSGSSYENALTRAGSDFETNLAAQEAQYNLQRESNLQNRLQMGFTPQFNTYAPKDKLGYGQIFAQAFGGAAPHALAGALGGGGVGGLAAQGGSSLVQLLRSLMGGGDSSETGGTVGQQFGGDTSSDNKSISIDQLMPLLGMLQQSRGN